MTNAINPAAQRSYFFPGESLPATPAATKVENAKVGAAITPAGPAPMTR